MARFIALNSSQHGSMGWKASNSFSFAAEQTTLPVFAEELPHLLPTIPLAFAAIKRQGKVCFQLVALLSLKPKQNLFVAPNGRWIGGYAPAVLRAFPFRLAPNPENQQLLLCFDQESGLLIEAAEPSERFFTQEGRLTERTMNLATFLRNCDESRARTEVLVQELASNGLLTPWELPTQEDGDKASSLKGLYRIDEAALQTLNGNTLESLCKNGALSIAYAQILSQPRINVFKRLIELQTRFNEAKKALSEEEVETYFDGKDDTLSFNF